MTFPDSFTWDHLFTVSFFQLTLEKYFLKAALWISLLPHSCYYLSFDINPKPPRSKTNAFISTSTASQIQFFSPTGAALKLFSSPAPGDVFYFSSKGTLSTSPFLWHKWKTTHLRLFNANFSHLQAQSSWIIKIKRNHQLQKINALAFT